MPNVVAIIQDDRVRRQVEQYLGQLEMDDLRLATFQNVEEFQYLYYRERDLEEPEDPPADGAEEESSEGGGAEGTELKLFSEIHMVIFALDSIGDRPAPWMEKLKKNLVRFKTWPETQPVRLIMLKYEDDGIQKTELTHPLLDDLIYIPIDRLVFLQKMQIFLNLPKLVTPRFLFSQETNQPIEISKIAKVDRLSDVGLGIRNPVALRRGLPGHFYVQLPTEKNPLELVGKVFRTTTHPEFRNLQLVYFSYFGLTKSALTQIRRSLSKSAHYQSLLQDDRAAFRVNPEDLFLKSEDKRTYGIAVIDGDPDVAQSLASQLSKDIDRVEVVHESSYRYFLHKYFEGGDQPMTKLAPKPTEAAEFYAASMIMTITSTDLKCLEVVPHPKEDAQFLGHNAAELFSSPDKWQSILADQTFKAVIEETLRYLKPGQEREKLIVFNDSQNEARAVLLTIRPGSDETTGKITITPASLGEILAKADSGEVIKSLDALIVDARFVPDDTSSWLQGLTEIAFKRGLLKERAPLKLFILAEDENQVRPKWLDMPEVLGVLLKPADVRQLSFLLAEFLPNKNTMYNFSNLGWAQPSLPIHVAKEIGLEALGEFGATLKSVQPLAPGSVIFLRKSIYDHAPNRCLASRVYHCAEHPSEKGFFQIHVTYFGINDAFLKFARTWIREHYAQQKNQSE